MPTAATVGTARPWMVTTAPSPSTYVADTTDDEVR